jgi:hypothetical protein
MLHSLKHKVKHGLRLELMSILAPIGDSR